MSSNEHHHAASRSSGSPRLSLVLWNGGVGGAEVFTVSLAERMRALGATIAIVFIEQPYPLATRFSDAELSYRSLGLHRGRDVLRHPRRYAAEIAASSPDGALLIDCGFMGGSLRAGGYDGPIVSVEHGALLGIRTQPWFRRFLWRLGRVTGAWADDIEVGVSDFILGEMLRYPHTTVLRRIYNGIDPARFAEPTQASPRTNGGRCEIGFAGRLIRGKGADYLIEAVGRLLSTHDIKLRIAGEGPERARLESLTETLGIKEAVRFLGLVHNMPEFWHTSDIVAVPSAEFVEACPIAPLEAMAAGKPVVATANGGLPEIVVDGVTGALVAPNNADALAEGLARYIGSAALRSSHGRAGQARVETCFHIDRCARSYLDLFSGLETG